MHRPRKIEVKKDTPVWGEFAHDVVIELWYNSNQSATLALTTEEAQTLQKALTEFLGEDQ